MSEQMDLHRYFTMIDTINDLKARIITETKAKSKWKKKYQQCRDKYHIKQPTRGDRALKLIIKKHNGELDITNKKIAEKCYLSESTIRNITFKYKRTLQ